MKSRGALFLDRDGVINRYRRGGVLSLEEFEYYDGTPEGLRRLAALGMPLAVVTNQSAVGRGSTTSEEVERIHRKLRDDASSWGVSIAATEYCPHLPDGGCSCRKPGVGLFEKIARELDIDLESSVLIGDSPCDIEAACRLGMTSIRVLTGRGEEPLGEGDGADHVAEDLVAAAAWLERVRESEVETDRQ